MSNPCMPTLFGRPSAVVTDNETLQSIIAELQNCRVSLSNGESYASRDAPRLLSDFSAELHAYFEAEESDDYFGAMMADCPALKGSLDRLRAAHEGFRDAAGTLRQLAGDESQGPELAVHIAKVIVDFRKYERAEGAILEDFFRLGGGNDGT